MTYELAFHPDALQEWRKLDNALREQFKKKLQERLLTPPVPESVHPDRYKIELQNAGYRLVIAVGKRERNAVYKSAADRTRISSMILQYGC